ncbi:MAG: ABC transporter permease [Tissierellia bacterium]|nr:ABC transporter permease [Tissierellia bacterium]
MSLKIFLNDFKKNKLINISIIVLIMISSILLSFASLMFVNLFSSIDQLMDQARTPHYLQMHMGPLNFSRLEDFAKKNENVKEFQVIEYLNLDKDQVNVGGKSLDYMVEDLGLVYQSEKFDFLLDLNNELVDLDQGELYLPLIFFKDEDIKLGDLVRIYDQKFEIKGFFRDSQMNSTLAGSKRILINKEDFFKLRDKGKIEYLIEFLLNDRSKMADFEKSFFENIPEKNGPSISYSMFRLINGLNDGLFIGILLLASFLILIISFLCIRLILLAKIEDEYREIGVMKAIGISHKEIKIHYLSSYVLLSLIGLLSGYVIAILRQDRLLENIYLYMGKASNKYNPNLLALISIFILFLIILFYVSRILKRLKEISPVKAIRNTSNLDRKFPKKSLRLGKLAFINRNLGLALSDLYARKKQYLTIFILISIASFLMIMPNNIKNSFEDPSFIQNMGIGKYDLSFELAKDLYSKDKEDALTQAIENDKRIKKFNLIKTIDLEFKLANNESAYIKTGFGDHQVFPINYSKGKLPSNSDEIALSSMYLEDLNLELGDFLSLNDQKKVKIIGEYSDISNGGKTAKANFLHEHDEAKLTYYLQVMDEKDLDYIVKDFSKLFPQLKVVSVSDYMYQAMGPLIRQLSSISLGLILINLVVIFLISLLFARLLLIKDRRQLAILKAIGFSNRDLKASLSYRFVIISIIAILFGILISSLLGNFFASLILMSFGANSISLLLDPIATYLSIPLAILTATLVSVNLASMKLSKIKISEFIKE